MASIFGYSSTEEPVYKCVRKERDYEVREYPPQIRASVTLEGGMDSNMSPAFRVLAGFIFGRNKPHETAAGAAGSTTKIAMTAPVTMSSSSQEGGAKKDDEAKKSEGSKEESEKIAMTAPVTMSEAGKGQQKAGSMTMSFIMPSKYKHVQDLPVPVDSRVTLQEVPATTYAVTRFSWGYSPKRRQDHEVKLRAAAVRDGLKLSTNPQDVLLLAYNPPWTLPWCKRNEVAIPVVA